MKKKLKRIIPNYLVKLVRYLKHGNFNYFLWLLPIKKNKIVISNYTGKGYGDNGKYVIEELIKQERNYDIVWLLRRNLIGKVQFPPQIRPVKYGTLRALIELATAKIWIDNCRKTFYPPKRREQVYIQTWHGGIALKQVEKDVENKLDSGYVVYAKQDSKMADYFISNSKFCTNMYKSKFWYGGKILEYGSPRCDILINNSNKVDEKVRDYFNIKKNTKILLYAPTFRADSNTEVYNINFDELLKVIEQKFEGEWNILVRLHPNISNKSNIMKYSSKIKNATDYDDMYELLTVSNILITDYSSSMFEFSYTNKPVFLYASDIESYVKDRDFYFDIHTLPYSLAEDNNQLFNILNQFDESKYLIEVSEFLSKLSITEKGDASSRVVGLINKIIK